LLVPSIFADNHDEFKLNLWDAKKKHNNIVSLVIASNFDVSNGYTHSLLKTIFIFIRNN